MLKQRSFYLISWLIYGCILGSNSWAKAADTNFDNSFYMSKICTSYLSREDHAYCDDGYIVKSEVSETGEPKETVLMEGIGSYGWNHIVIDKLDPDTYHVYVGCGSPCGAHMLFGRGGKEQHFGLYFNYDAKSRCSVEYDHDKSLWIARRFFSNKKIPLPATRAVGLSAMYPVYEMSFDSQSRLIMTHLWQEDIIKRSPNPCTANQK